MSTEEHLGQVPSKRDSTRDFKTKLVRTRVNKHYYYSVNFLLTKQEVIADIYCFKVKRFDRSGNLAWSYC